MPLGRLALNIIYSYWRLGECLMYINIKFACSFSYLHFSIFKSSKHTRFMSKTELISYLFCPCKYFLHMPIIQIVHTHANTSLDF